MTKEQLEMPMASQRIMVVGRKSRPITPGVVSDAPVDEDRQIMYDLYARQMGKIQERAQTKRPDPKYVKGGEVLRIIRIRLNVTQRQFGLLLDVSHATLSCWESGHSRPPRLSVLGLKSILPAQVASLVTLESFGYRTNPNNV